jgi:hypothetical protein
MQPDTIGNGVLCFLLFFTSCLGGWEADGLREWGDLVFFSMLAAVSFGIVISTEGNK